MNIQFKKEKLDDLIYYLLYINKRNTFDGFLLMENSNQYRMYVHGEYHWIQNENDAMHLMLFKNRTELHK